MFLSRHNRKIFNSVVIFNIIDVMNVFIRKKLSSDKYFHNMSMFEHPNAIHGDFLIFSLRRTIRSRILKSGVIARLSTELRSRASRRRYMKHDRTSFAFFRHASIIASNFTRDRLRTIRLPFIFSYMPEAFTRAAFGSILSIVTDVKSIFTMQAYEGHHATISR